MTDFTSMFYRMIESTSGLGLGAVTGILAAVGVFMFLLPPVPGVPVYLTLGIVLAATGHEILGEKVVLYFNGTECTSPSLKRIQIVRFRMDWFNTVFYRRCACVEAFLECIATKVDWREPFTLCVSKAICWH